MDGKTLGPNHRSIPLSFASYQQVGDFLKENRLLYGYESFYDVLKKNLLVEYISHVYFLVDPEKTYSYTAFSDLLSKEIGVEEKINKFLDNISKENFKTFFESYVKQDKVLQKRWKKERVKRLIGFS
jgi:hypothetical protein